MPIRGYKTIFSVQDYAKYKEVFEVARGCKADENEKCVHFAHAMAYFPLLQKNLAVPEQILTEMCFNKEESEACIVLGDILKESKNPAVLDVIRESIDTVKMGCILGNPKACRIYAEECKKYSYQSDYNRSILWNMAAYQMAEKNLKTLEEDEKNKDIDYIYQRRTHYKVPSIIPDQLAATHFEIAKSIANILELAKDSSEFNLVDINEIKNRKKSNKYSFENILFKIRRDTMYRANILGNRFKNGYFLSNEIPKLSNEEIEDKNKQMPSWVTRILKIKDDLPSLLNQTISRNELEEKKNFHFNFAVNRLERYCSESGNKEDGGCFYLAQIFNEFYKVNREKSYLTQAISALRYGCLQKNQIDCCNQLGDLYYQVYNVNSNVKEISDDVVVYNHSRAKFYYYKSCTSNPLYCYQFANVLKAEDDMDNALKMLVHACKIGGNTNACSALKLRRKVGADKDNLLIQEISEIKAPVVNSEPAQPTVTDEYGNFVEAKQ